MRKARLAIIGSGAMGSALARAVIAAKLFRPADVVVADAEEARRMRLASQTGAQPAADNRSAIRDADIILIAVKPAVVKEVLAEVGKAVTANQLVISIAAGVKLETIESGLPAGVGVIRAIPNTPCRIGAGATGFCRGASATKQQAKAAQKIFDAVGISFEVAEQQINAVTGLSGSGPAYIFVLIEALSDAGVRVGLTRDVATKLAAQTVLGAAKLVLDENEHPAKLKDQVTSPGGTTIAGIDALERCGFRSALIEAVRAATGRADELG